MSTFGLDPDLDEVEQLTLRETASSMENLLVSHATGTTERDARYQAPRSRLIAEVGSKNLPDFVRTCRSLGQFWAFIKKLPTYAERREALWNAFGPVIVRG